MESNAQSKKKEEIEYAQGLGLVQAAATQWHNYLPKAISCDKCLLKCTVFVLEQLVLHQNGVAFKKELNGVS